MPRTMKKKKKEKEREKNLRNEPEGLLCIRPICIGIHFGVNDQRIPFKSAIFC